MAMICVADGDCTTWSTTIPASIAQGPALPFENISPESQETCYEVSNIQRLIFMTVDDIGGGVYNILIEDPFQSGLISSPQGAPNNVEGALPDCLDGTDPNRIFVWDIAINGSAARQFIWFQSQTSFVSSGISGTFGAFYSIQINTNLSFPPSQYPYLTLTVLQGLVTEFGDAIQFGFAPNEITINSACCQSAEGTTVDVTNTGATTWDLTIEDPLQTNLISDPDEADNNVLGSVLDCLSNGDPDAIMGITFSVLGASYTFEIPNSMVTAIVTTPHLLGADATISIDTSLVFTTAGLPNTLQADLSAANGLAGYMTVAALRCDGVQAAQQITGTGTQDDPLIPNVVLHPDGSIICGTQGLELAASFSINPQGPTSTPDSGVLFPPNVNGCANWICELPSGEWYAPEHDVFLARNSDAQFGGGGIAVGPLVPGFVVGAPNNHILGFTIINTFDRPIVPRIIIRAQSRLVSPPSVGSTQFIAALVTESWTGNVYQQDIATATNLHGDVQIEDEKSTTFVVMTNNGLYTPNFGGYDAIPPGENITYSVNVGHTSAGAVNWTRSVLVIEAALFTTT